MKELQAIIRALLTHDAGASWVLATLVSVAGSSYRRPGARLLVSADGKRIGSISGGCLEEDVINRAKEVAHTGRAELITYDTSEENDLVWGVGLGCHGVVQILLEKLPVQRPWVEAVAANLARRQPTSVAVVWRAANPAELGTRLADQLPAAPNTPAANERIFLDTIIPPPALVIFGAGDDAQPLARFARELAWHVTIADPRSAFATPERFPTADVLVVAPAAELVARVAPESNAFAVVMTHHYVHDRPILDALLRRPLRYVGLLGPKKRAEQILADLDLAKNAESRSRLHAPVGLDLGAETPEDVALSILAEMRATLGDRNARPLRDRSRPIHD